MKATFEVLRMLSSIRIGGEEYGQGTWTANLSVKDTKELAAHVGAGGVRLVKVEGNMPVVVESDEASLSKRDAAIEDGRWQEGNLLDFEAVEAAKESEA